MKKLSAKILLTIFIVFSLSSIFPRIILQNVTDIPNQEMFQSPEFLIGMILTAFISLSLFGLAIKYMIIDRIRSLSLATKQVSQGNFDLYMESKGHDELSSLTNDFNKMVKELKANEYLNKEFVRNFSHEFKTPISAIKGFAELIESGQLNNDEIIEYSKIISTESTRLAQLSKNMLQLSVLDSTSIIKMDQKFNLSEQIRSVIQLFQLSWEEKKLDLVLDIDEVYITTNKDLTYQIWKNLIENAIQYTMDNQKLDISVKSDGKNALFEITNYGVGISIEEQEHIFDIFYVGKSSTIPASTGIGLSIVKKITEKLKGSVEVTSMNDLYTSFRISLPLETD